MDDDIQAVLAESRATANEEEKWRCLNELDRCKMRLGEESERGRRLERKLALAQTMKQSLALELAEERERFELAKGVGESLKHELAAEQERAHKRGRHTPPSGSYDNEGFYDVSDIPFAFDPVDNPHYFTYYKQTPVAADGDCFYHSVALGIREYLRYSQRPLLTGEDLRNLLGEYKTHLERRQSMSGVSNELLSNTYNGAWSRITGGEWAHNEEAYMIVKMLEDASFLEGGGGFSICIVTWVQNNRDDRYVPNSYYSPSGELNIAECEECDQTVYMINTGRINRFSNGSHFEPLLPQKHADGADFMLLEPGNGEGYPSLKRI